MLGLVVIDMVNDFIRQGKELEVPKGREIIPNIQKIINKARKKNIPIIYSKDTHKENDPEFNNWPSHSLEGTEGSEVIKELEPNPEDIIIEKKKFSSFRGTKLDERLKELEVDEIILVGVLSDICILHTAIDAYYRDYGIMVPEDCVATVSDEKQQFALNHIKNVLGYEVTNSEKLFN